QLAQALEQVVFADFPGELVGNTEAKFMIKEDIKCLLHRLLMDPVRFYESIATILDACLTKFIEIGPGKVLSGFVKNIDKTAHVVAFEF
ncbi:malonyl CoA-acyl carrier protein transacylase, partial [Streptococcus suis]